VAQAACNWRVRLRSVAALFLGVALITFPWIIRNALVFRHFVPIRSSFGLLFWAGNNPLATGLWEDQEIQHSPDKHEWRHGAFDVGGHSTSFNFKARTTLPPDVLDRLERVNEVERDRLLLREVLKAIARAPGRFLKLTVWRCLDLMAAPPSRRHQEGAAFVGRTIDEVAAPLAPLWAAHQHAVIKVGWAVLRAYLLISFVGAMFGAVRARTPLALLIAALLASWLLVFGLTHAGYAVYRFSLEPFVLIGLTGALVRPKFALRPASPSAPAP